MLQKTFSIYGDDLQNSRFFVEIGRKHIACFCKDETTNALTAMEFFQFGQYEANEFDAVLYEVKNNSRLMTTGFENICLVWNTEECMCIPTAYSNEATGNDYFNLLYGEKENTVLYGDEIAGCMVVSRIDTAIQETIKSYFPNANYYHQFYFLIKNILRYATEGNRMHLVFYPDYFTVVAVKNKGLQIIQTKEYNTPEDVLYNILNICKQYEMPQEETMIEAYGLIVAGSSLFSTLLQYLQNFSLAATSADSFAAEGFNENPLHFFQHFSTYDPV